MSTKHTLTRWVSFYELRHLGVEIEVESTQLGNPSYKIVKFNWKGKNYSEEDIEKVLWRLGLNVKQYRYEIEEPCAHKTTVHGVKVDYRFSAPERLDKEWITTGNPSEEAKLASCKMKDFTRVAHHLANGNLKNY